MSAKIDKRAKEKGPTACEKKKNQQEIKPRKHRK